MADNQSKGPPLLNFTFSGRPPTAAAFDAKLRASLTKAGVKILSSGDDLPKAGDFCVAKDKVDAKDPLSSIIYVCNSSRSVYDVVTNEYYAYTVPAASEGKMLAMNVSGGRARLDRFSGLFKC